MTSFAVDNLLESELRKLTPSQKERVLDFAKSLPKRRHPGTPGDDLLRFAGSLSADEAIEMVTVIEEQCEQVDSDE